MSDLGAYLEMVWDEILSRDSEKITSTFLKLSDSDQNTVKTHLKRMVTEPGWHDEQVISAAAALKAIETLVGEIK